MSPRHWGGAQRGAATVAQITLKGVGVETASE